MSTLDVNFKGIQRTLIRRDLYVHVIPVGFMFINCKDGSQDAVVQRIKKIPGVVYAFKVDKSYDIVVKIESISNEEFASAIGKIRSSSEILNSDTMVGFKKP